MTLKRIIMLSLAALLLLPLALAGCGTETITESVESEAETITKEKAVGKYRPPFDPEKLEKFVRFVGAWLYLNDDGTFSFTINSLSSYMTGRVGTWKLEGNRIIMDVKPRFEGDEEYLSLEFADENTIIWHVPECSNMSDYGYSNVDYDVPLYRVTETEESSGAESGSGNETTTESGESEAKTITMEKAVGRYKPPETSVYHAFGQSLTLKDDGTFSFFMNAISSHRSGMSGTWRLEGNKIITEVKPKFEGEKEYLSLEFADENTIIWHTSESSDLFEYMISNDDDIPLYRVTETEEASGAESGSVTETTTESGESEAETITKEKAVGKYKPHETSVNGLYSQMLILYDDETFLLFINYFYKSTLDDRDKIEGTWRLEGNKIITEVKPKSEGEKEYLSLEFADENTIILHTSECSDLSHYMISNDGDIPLYRVTKTEESSGAESASGT